MPYPSSTPTERRDLVALPLPPRPESLLGKYGLGDEEALFAKLSKGIPNGMKALANVYTFKDGLDPPFRKTLYVIGYIPLAHSVVRTLIGEDRTVHDSSLHCCSLAVKRGDGAHVQQLQDPQRHKNSFDFAEFVRRLRKEGIVAIVGQDRYGRIAILKPVPLRDSSESGFHEDDFHLRCYVGKTKDIKETLSQFQSQQSDQSVVPRSPPPPPGGFDDNGPVWKNPEHKGVYPEDEPVFVPDDASHTGEVDPYIPPYTSGSGTQADNWVPTALGSSNGHNANAPSQQWDQVADVSRKRPRLDGTGPDNNVGNGNHFHDNEQARRTEAFYETVDRSEETGPDSQIYHMRKFNNWVKALQMQEVNPRTKSNQTGGLRILDLVRLYPAACGAI